MSPTLLEGFVAAILLVVAWRIGRILTPWLLYRLRSRRDPGPKKTPPTIDL